MDYLNWGNQQLGLIAPADGDLQVWGISSTVLKRDLARSLSEGAFRRSMGRIWAKGSQ